MNPQWNTPPDGDFVRYVDRLTAQAALPRRSAVAEHQLDVGIAAPPGGVRSDAAKPIIARSDSQRAKDNLTLAKVVLPIWALVLVVLWAIGAPIGVLLFLLIGGFWAANKLRKLNLSGIGTAKWQKVLEEAARKARETKA